MSVEYRTGDLFTQDLPALGQGVNLRAAMGAGVAKEFRRRWPGMYKPYQRWCYSGAFELGDVMPYGDNPIIYNLATQDRPGPHASLDAIRRALSTMLSDAQDRQVDAVGIPQIGAGIGGLRWADVAQVVEDVAGPSEVHLVVVSLPARMR